MASHLISTLPDEARLCDFDLVQTDTQAARDELERRVMQRRQFGLSLRGLIPQTAMSLAPDETVELLADLDVDLAQDERRRRGGLR